MLFGLANASSSFQNFINVLENDILDLFVAAYMEDILIFSKTFQEHKKHIKIVLGCLQAAGLQLDIDKCEFEVHKTKYLGLLIQSAFPDGCPGCVKMGPTKTSIIVSWNSSQSVKDVQGFLGFANFYWGFIKNFVKLAAFFTALIKEDKQF